MTLAAWLAERKRIADAATPGPWQWFGNTRAHTIYLATINRGRVYVMDFVRWGMSAAAPRFQRDQIMVRADALAVMEVEHRKDFRGIDHPDAAFIADARTSLPVLVAIAEIATELVEYVAESPPPEHGGFSVESRDHARSTLARIEALVKEVEK